MPMYQALRRSSGISTESTPEQLCCDEMLVADARNGMRPTQLVDHKFGVALGRELDREALACRGRSEISGNPRIE